jgi:membrane-bound lytic murein transglycosylase D
MIVNRQIFLWSSLSFLLGAFLWAMFTTSTVDGVSKVAHAGYSLHSWGIASDSIPNANALYHRVPQYLPIPDKLSYCGEEIDLNVSDIRERFERELYIYANLNYQIMFYLKRAPRIFPYMEGQLKANNMPDDLKYLAVVESDLIPVLISARGARGLWQFMPETAKEYGMRVTDNIDERMHLDKSTQAAFKYLKHARERTGSWSMASASYNMGLTRATTHMREQYTSDYFRMHMNLESARYVFKILAVKTIMENPELYGYHIDDKEAYQSSKVKTVSVTSEISDLPKWAIEHGTTYYDLRRVNPWIVGRSLPAGRYQIDIPLE